MNLSEKKILGIGEIKKRIPALRKAGRSIVFTNGCFDLMHLGHVTYLQKAKKGNRVLIVGLNSDKSISNIKGPSRPICPQNSRAAVLSALTCVDFVVLFNEETPLRIIKAIKPDILIKGADYKGKEIVGSNIAKKIEIIPFVKGFSTSHIIDRILKSNACT